MDLTILIISLLVNILISNISILVSNVSIIVGIISILTHGSAHLTKTIIPGHNNNVFQKNTVSRRSSLRNSSGPLLRAHLEEYMVGMPTVY